MNISHISHIAADSGGVLYVIALMFLVALTVIIERTWYLLRVANANVAALQQVDEAAWIDAPVLVDLSERYADLPTGRLLAAAARRCGAARDGVLRDALAPALDEVVMREAPGIDRFLWVLDTVVTLAPLLGLFGTILGMFNAFQVLSNPGNAPTQVTGGVAEALVATASGLFVAMVGLVFFNGLQNRVRNVVHQLETLKGVLLNRLVTISQTQRDYSKGEDAAPLATVNRFAVHGA